MAQRFSRYGIFLFLVVVLLHASAKETWKDPATGITWTYSIAEQGGVKIGWGKFDRAIAETTSGELIIPNQINGMNVVAINNYAFWNCAKLTSVVIMPDSLMSIGKCAFSGCTRLKSIVMPAIKLDELGDEAFSYCENLEHIDIPNGLAELSYHSFLGCSRLVSITINSDITSIGGGVFSECSQLSSIHIPSNVTSIGGSAFEGCSSLETILIPGAVKSIGVSAFKGCTALTTIDISPGLEIIQERAFNGCTELVSVQIPQGVTTIGQQAFAGCAKLSSLTIPRSVVKIGQWAFSGCKDLASIVDNCIIFSNGLLNDNAIFLPDGTRLIADAVFMYSKAESATLPSSVEIIGEQAFFGCSNLHSINIPEKVYKIGFEAFKGCGELGDGVVTKNDCVLCVNGIIPESVTIPNGSRLIADGVFSYNENLKNAVLPSSMSRIGIRAFYGSHLTSVTMPSTIEDIGEYAFCECQLISINLPDNLTNIKEGMFADNRSLTELKIPSSVTNIGSYAFYRCYSLASIVIPEAVQHIGIYAFDDCPELSSVALLSVSTKIDYDYAFGSCDNIVDITAPGFVGGINGISVTNFVVTRGTQEIPSLCFQGCSRLETVTIPSSVRHIGNDAFANCEKLKYIKFQGDAPIVADALGCSNSVNAYVYRGSIGWDNDEDGLWNGLTIQYLQNTDPIPRLNDNASSLEIANALSGSSDVKLMINITNAATYNAYRLWAGSVKKPDGSAVAGVQAVKDAPNAWLSFAIGSQKLLDTLPTNGQMKIDQFKPSSTDGLFDFSVSIDDIPVGSNAAEENLKKVFGLEGGSNLKDLSSTNVNITFGTPSEGKVKFTAGPKDTKQSPFFMKVKMTP